MHIIHVASEMAPIAKVGGLGDVVLGLSRALQAAGHTVEVILPRYSSLDYSSLEDLHICQRELWSFCAGAWIHNTVWSGWVQGIRVYLIEPHNESQYFGRPGIYGFHDDIERFTYFSRAALEFLSKGEICPDILHIHEWQAAAIAPLYWELFQPLGFGDLKLVMTLHNLEHQGRCKLADLDRIGLSGKRYLSLDKMQDDQRPSMLNLLKGGINYCDQITTVSPSYAEEIVTVEGGHGLDETIRANAHKLTGILNGLDEAVWSPLTDPYLPVHYDVHALERKKEVKRHLKERLALSSEDRPLVATIARLVPQKGVELIRDAIFHTLEEGGQFILLGSSPIAQISHEFQALKLHFAENRNLHLELQPQEELTHLIYGGSDMFVVPSKFEPCGLTQQMAMEYGSVPIVRATGGLKDTVFDGENGYLFKDCCCDAMRDALLRAFHTYREEPQVWEEMMVRGMSERRGWETSAASYIEVYSKKQKRSEPPLPPRSTATARTG
jgi:starch synthase